MDEEERELLEKTAESTEECLKILKKIQRGRRFEMITRILYWLIIVGLAVGTYYYIQPYINNLLSIYKNINTNIKKIENVKDNVLDFKLF